MSPQETCNKLHQLLEDAPDNSTRRQLLALVDSYIDWLIMASKGPGPQQPGQTLTDNCPHCGKKVNINVSATLS